MHAIARPSTVSGTPRDTEALESGVRYYSRIFPARIRSALGAVVRDVHGREWVDFYGHNHPAMTARVIA